MTSRGGLCYNSFMPTKQWTADREMFTFWMMPEDAKAFRAACKRAKKRQSVALREMVKAMVGKDGPDAK